MRRKGQFFIISAVVVVILLMSLTNMLSIKDNQDSSIHLRDVNDALRVLENTNSELSELMSILSDDNIYAVLDSYLINKKALLSNRGYLMIYNINESVNIIKITYDIESIYMEQTIPIQKFSRISAWDFDEGVGVVAKDKTNSNDGEFINFSWTENSGWTDNCISKKCIVFDGINDYVLYNKTINLDSFSIAFWLKPNEIGVGKKQGILYVNGSSHDIRLHLNEDNIEFDRMPGNKINIESNITQDIWTFIVVTHNKTDDKSNIYKDGYSQDETTSDSINFDGIITLAWNSTITNKPFNGSIDNFKLYNNSLTAEQVQFLYSNGRN